MEKEIASLPEGKLIYTKNGDYYKWFISNGKNPIYLSKGRRELAEQLVYRNYCMKSVNDIEMKLCALQQCLMTIQEIEACSQLTLDCSTEEGKLLNRYFHNHSKESKYWLEEDCEYSTNYPEHLIHNTLDGHVVRSKSEVMIANALYQNKIPYKYECGIYLDDVQYFPDFTLFHEAKKEKIYWEHFGMMDKPSYCEKAYNKLRIYGKHGIIPSINLIATYETQEHPLDSMKIQQMIDEYL